MSTQTEVLATMANMQAYAGSHDRAVFAYSPLTGEEYSADPADYFNARADWTMTDAEGEPMILARRGGITPLMES
jgi:hypothetical protein